MDKKRLAVCVSGGGTNLQAILDRIADGTISRGEVVRVISNNPNAYALERANLDALVFEAYGLNASEMDTILADFPLVDQVNARLTDGLKPTIQLVRAHAMGDKGAMNEAKNACAQGAMPYVPNEHMRSMLR